MRLEVKGHNSVKHKQQLNKDTLFCALCLKTPEEIDAYFNEEVKDLEDIKSLVRLLFRQHLSQHKHQ